MSWIPRPETARWEAPPGVAPWREISDEEFAALEETTFHEERGALRRWFEHVDDETKTTKKKAAKAAGGDD